MLADVNNAHGTISGALPGSTGHVTMPVSFEFRRLDELMHVRYGECTLRFDVRTASDASLRPVPGERCAAGERQGVHMLAAWHTVSNVAS